MAHVVAHRASYQPRRWLLEQWDTVATTEGYLDFFREMGWKG
jgi:hypothetical protein